MNRIRNIVFFLLAFQISIILGPDAQAKYTVTQYAGTTGSQSMFYTITNKSGKLVIIDGGWRRDAELVKSVIAQHGNKVNAWIITHPHPDHAGALNAILEEGGCGIKIKKIYTTWVDRKHYRNTARYYDEYEEYETFRRLIKKRKNVIFLKENDEIDLLKDLHMTVLHSWTKALRKYSVNVCNYGSLVFRLDGKKDSILFMGDIGKPVENSIIKKHKKQLKATYVQCAHHGNWGCSNKIYRKIKPKKAFFDAPGFITADTSGTYTAPALIRWMQSRNIRTLTFASAPNKVTLR